MMPRIKKGSKIKRDGSYFLYYHYGVYIGKDSVIHYYKSGSSSSAKIVETSLEDFLEGNELVIEDEPYNRKHANEIIERAKSQEYRMNYNAFGSDGENCEHFVNWCYDPESPISNQASLLMNKYSYICSKCENNDGLVECENCIKGKVTCDCINGKVDCDVCKGSSVIECEMGCSNGKIDCKKSDCIDGNVKCIDCGGQGVSICEECESTGLIEEECNKCLGDGCKKCGNSGSIFVDCWLCDGKGESNCINCEGAGEIECTECDGEGFSDCPECHGSFESDCWKCAGSGEIDDNECSGTGRIDCDICNGSSYVECNHCNGSGTEPDPLNRKKIKNKV